jgi:hypothetical protein
MKTLLRKIDQMTEKIEMGFFTRSESLRLLRNMRQEIADKFEEGSDEFIQCVTPLIDIHVFVVDSL